MNWCQYLLAILLFNGVGLVVLFALLMSQGALPLNPQHLPGLSWDLALNTAVSFVSNTNWQAYAGESTLSYLSQMAGLTVQNFLSAATGIAVIFAFTRAWSRQQVSTLGNAWVDLTRITLWLLLPISLLIAVFFIQQGVPQNFLPYQAFTSLEGCISRCQWGRSLRRKRSKCWVLTAAGSLTPTHRTRLKTRRR
jgi:K+-transporting ATPase ATPase A chain